MVKQERLSSPPKPGGGVDGPTFSCFPRRDAKGHRRIVGGDRIRVVSFLPLRRARPFFAKAFFPTENETAALLAAFATYAAGFVVRPLGGVILGRRGDLTGRKNTFLISIVIMGFATFTVGLLPTFDQLGWIAPILLVTLRLIQGLAMGGEYGGAATYVAEYTEGSRRGYATGWVQTTATLGLLLALGVIGACRMLLPAGEFEQWGWRLPFLRRPSCS